jgi:hypothetical protein
MAWFDCYCWQYYSYCELLSLDGNADNSGTDTITFQYGSLWLSATGGVSSALILQPSSTGSIVGVAPTYWSGSNGVQIMAPTYIRLDFDLDSASILTFGLSGSMINAFLVFFDVFLYFYHK